MIVFIWDQTYIVPIDHPRSRSSNHCKTGLPNWAGFRDEYWAQYGTINNCTVGRFMKDRYLNRAPCGLPGFGAGLRTFATSLRLVEPKKWPRLAATQPRDVSACAVGRDPPLKLQKGDSLKPEPHRTELFYRFWARHFTDQRSKSGRRTATSRVWSRTEFPVHPSPAITGTGWLLDGQYIFRTRGVHKRKLCGAGLQDFLDICFPHTPCDCQFGLPINGTPPGTTTPFTAVSAAVRQSQTGGVWVIHGWQKRGFGNSLVWWRSATLLPPSPLPTRLGGSSPRPSRNVRLGLWTYPAHPPQRRLHTLSSWSKTHTSAGAVVLLVGRSMNSSDHSKKAYVPCRIPWGGRLLLSLPSFLPAPGSGFTRTARFR